MRFIRGLLVASLAFTTLGATLPAHAAGPKSAVSVITSANGNTYQEGIANGTNPITGAPQVTPRFDCNWVTPSCYLTPSAMPALTGAVTTSPGSTVTSLAPGAVVGSLGYQPVSKLGDSVSGSITMSSLLPTNQVYFAGVNPKVMLTVNLNGVADNALLVNPGVPVGDPNNPLIGLWSSIVSNTGHGSDINTNIAHYRAAGIFQATAYANSANLDGVNIQMNYDVTAPNDFSFIPLEINVSTARSADCTGIGGPIYCNAGVVASGAANADTTKSLAEGFLIEGGTNYVHYGYVAGINGIKDIGFADFSVSTTAFEAIGSHVTGFYVVPGSIQSGGNAFLSQGFSVSQVGAVTALSLNAPNIVATLGLNAPYGSIASSGSPCSPGYLQADSLFLYVCSSANTWKRISEVAF